MKAAVYRRAEGLVVEDVPVPEPGEDGVLVKVANAGFCGSDHSLIESGLLTEGTILGHEVSGTVAGWGRGIKGLREGGKVMIRPTFCGTCRECRMGKPHLCEVQRRTIGIGDLPGAFAEYVKVYPQMLIPVPEGIDSRNAALAETFAAALHGIRCSGNGGGSVLVMGGGPIGLASVRCLKLLGFSPITLSEPVEAKRDIGKRFGADYAVDPLTADLRRESREWTAGVGFETILECSGAAENISLAVELAAKGASVCMVSILFRNLSLNLPMLMNFKELRFAGAYSNTHAENQECLRWMAQGKVDARPLISDVIPIEALPRVYRERIHPGKAVKVLLRIGEEF